MIRWGIVIVTKFKDFGKIGISTQRALSPKLRFSLHVIVRAFRCFHIAILNCSFVRSHLEYDRGYSFERNCVLRRWESETLK